MPLEKIVDKLGRDVDSLFNKFNKLDERVHAVETYTKVSQPKFELMLQRVVDSSNEVLYSRLTKEYSEEMAEMKSDMCELRGVVKVLQELPKEEAYQSKMALRKLLRVVAITAAVTSIIGFFVALVLNNFLLLMP